MTHIIKSMLKNPDVSLWDMYDIPFNNEIGVDEAYNDFARKINTPFGSIFAYFIEFYKKYIFYPIRFVISMFTNAYKRKIFGMIAYRFLYENVLSKHRKLFKTKVVRFSDCRLRLSDIYYW